VAQPAPPKAQQTPPTGAQQIQAVAAPLAPPKAQQTPLAGAQQIQAVAAPLAPPASARYHGVPTARQ
jgi:hypothetical protein